MSQCMWRVLRGSVVRFCGATVETDKQYCPRHEASSHRLAKEPSTARSANGAELERHEKRLNRRRANSHYCSDKSKPIEKDCPGCVDALYEWAAQAEAVVGRLRKWLQFIGAFDLNKFGGLSGATKKALDGEPAPRW